MKKMTKRVISIFLSVLMLISAVPAFSLTACADTEKKVGLIAEYFSGSDLSMDYSGNGNSVNPQNLVWWTDAEKPGTWGVNGRDAVYFNNQGTNKQSTVVINDAFKNKGVTAESGFSISWYGYAYANDNWRRFFDLCTSSDDTYTFVTVEGITGIRKSGSGDTTSTPANKSAVTTWYKYLLSCDTNGATLYRDGVEVAHANYGDNGNWMEKMINEADLKVAQSAYSNDRWLDGLISEMRLYDTACTPADIEGVTREAMTSNYVENRIINATPEVFNAPAYHVNTVATGAYSNVVWHQIGQTAWAGVYNKDEVKDFDCFKVKFATPNNIVLAYDGHNETREPIVMQTTSHNKSNIIRTVFPLDRSLLAFADGNYWRGDHDTQWDAFKYAVTQNKIGYAPYHDMDTATQDNTNSARNWYNTLSYVGTGNTDTYYDVIGSREWNFFAGTSSSCHDNTDVWSSGVTYVLNYKPAYDIIDSKEYNAYAAKSNLYTAESFAAYKTAYANLVNLNVTGYFDDATTSNVESKVQAAANAIKTAVAAYNTAEANLVCTHIGGTATCQAKAVCTNCGEAYGELADHDYAKTTDGYVTTYTCKYGCGDSYTVDKTALASAITVAQAEMSQSFYEGKYTSASRNAFETALEKAIAARDDDEVTDEDTIDAKAAAIAIGNLKVAKYTISANVVYEDDKYGAGVSISGDGSYEYGETAGLYANINQITEGRYSGADEYIIYKWVKTVNGQDIKLGTNAKNVYDVVTDSATYTCYVLKYDASSDDGTEKARVRYLDKSNNTIGIDYAEIGSVVSPSCEYPEIPFYDFAGWECVYGDPENVGSQEVVFKATYTYSKVESNKCQIVGLNGVNVEGKTTYEAYYDELVTLTGSETGYAYADENGVIISAITGDQIYAPHNNKTIYIIALTVEEAEKANTLITGHIMNANKLTLNVQSYVPEGATLVETGIVASKKVADPAIGVTGCSSIAAQNVGSKGEFSMTMGFTLTGDTVHFKSYVIYRDSDNELHTAYSDVYDVVLA